ncbi:MAG: histidinol-phosphate transaminase [Clostridia bacterium]
MVVESIRKSAYTCSEYVPGKSTDQVREAYGLDRVVKLGSNENSYGPFPGTIEAMAKEITRLNIYPEKNYVKLKDLLGEMYGVNADWVGLGHGAGNVLDVLAKTFLEEGDEVIVPEKTYGLYSEISKVMGATVVTTPMKNEIHIDLDAVKAAITDKTKLIYICNPNNPTSVLEDKGELTELIKGLPKNTWLILDEAYAEFSNPEDLPDAIKLMQEDYNLIRVRTFSKYYGLAGGRIGYCVAKPDVTDMYNTVSEPFNSNRIGLAGAVALLENCKEEAKFYADKMNDDRAMMTSKMRAIGLEVVESGTNFIFFKTPYDAGEIGELLLRKGVIVRPCGGWSYPNHIRVSIGNTEENMEFIAKLGEVLDDLEK